MAVQVNPITQSLPATTAIQDPATRRFAQAVEDALRALRSEEGAVESLKKAADAMNNAVAGGTPPSIAQWLFSSELYQKLTTEIARVDVKAKQDLLAESMARSAAIAEINATLAIAAAYDPLVTYAVGDMVTYDGKLYQAILATTGNLPTNTTYWKKVGDYATLGDVVAAHTLEINNLASRVTTDERNLTAEIADRQALATQVRGTYTGTDVNLVSQGLIYSERVARATADSNEVAARQSLSAKLTGSNDPSGLTLETLASGLLFDEKQARVSGDGANASSISALRAQVGVTEAGALTTGLILDEKNVRASNDAAIVSAVNTALAQITGVSTSISQSGENLVATWSQAQANKWSQIESEVLTSGGQTIRAALQQEATTRANADGSLGAQWTLKTDINGYISGFGFASTANNATPTSEFIVRADKFAVVMPGYGEHVPFAIGPSGAEFTGLTSWGNVTGDGRPENNATVGATFGTATLVATLVSENFTDYSGWTNVFGGGEVSVTADGTATDGYCLSIGNNSGDDQAWLVRRSQNIAYDTNKLYRLRVRAKATAGAGGAYFGLEGVASDGTTLVNQAGSNSFGSQHYIALSGQALSSGWIEYVGYVKGHSTSPQNNATDPQYPTTMRTGVAFVRPLVLVNYPNQPGAVLIDYLYLEEVSAVAPNLTGKISPDNVTTYIANAALGNAQIANAAITSAKIGAAQILTANIGDGQITNAKIGTAAITTAKIGNAQVDTLQIAGNAVTIPVHSRPADVSGIGGTFVSVASVWIDALGSTVSLIASASVRGGSGETATVTIRILAPNGSAIGGGTGISVNAAYAHLSCITSSTLAGTYTLQANKTPGSNSGYATNISLFALGTKR